MGNKIRDQLIEKLQTTNIERATIENIAQLTKLLYKEEEENEDEEIREEEKNKRVVRCEMCEKIVQGKTELAKHIKKSKECAEWYERDKIAYKFCYKGACNFIDQKQEIVDRHTELDSDGIDRPQKKSKTLVVDKIKAADQGRNDVKELAKGKVIKIENEWKCTICGKIMKNGKSLTGHMGKHNKGKGTAREKEVKEKKNVKACIRRKELTKEQRKRIERSNENDVEIPEKIKVEVHLGRIKMKKENENIEWECSKCGKSWEKPHSTMVHVSKCQKFKMKYEKEGERHMICPYCKNLFQERKTLTTHLFRDTCVEYEKIRGTKTGVETWEDIVRENKVEEIE